jgi:hypothetical protein|tara:strand:+ start:502 stop:669 length:168 start_codon:yes stop_codon:yes gene_type:complete
MTKEESLKQKRFELAEREYQGMEGDEVVDLLLTFVYNDMSDETVVKLHDDIFAER